jgi:hypothetical protein
MHTKLSAVKTTETAKEQSASKGRMAESSCLVSTFINRIMRLQGTSGNHAVQRLMQTGRGQAQANRRSETQAQKKPGIEIGNQITSMSVDGSSLLQRAPALYITEIVVDQTTPQSATATWSDGHTDSGECSTGKGHCCFDAAAGAAEGGVCSAARSTQRDNNCTPVGTFRVTYQIPKTAGGVELWTQFHDAKSVALHDYDPNVNGTPLSHGCVRLHRPFAETIYRGARIGVTRVTVQNMARPNCTNTELIAEWEDDFYNAGRQPPDGTQINPLTNQRYTQAEIARERRHIQETRSEMRSALGVDNAGLDAALAATQGGAAVAARIPRCVPAATVEEQQLPAAQAAGFLNATGTVTATAFSTALQRVNTQTAAEQLVRQQGNDLWLSATAAARGGGSGTDDRQLYWTRLKFSSAIRQWNPAWVRDADTLRRLQERLLQILEDGSRGRTDVTFPTAPDVKRILISGFDPFGFTNGGDIAQSNLSGASVLALDGTTLSSNNINARVEGVIFPVRFIDFNAGVVESFFSPYMTGPQAVNMIMTISQGGNQFELEEWAGRRRSSGSYTDNLDVRGGGTETHPVVPPGVGSGAEFIHTNVPPAMLGSMRGALGRPPSAIPEEIGVRDLTPGASTPTPRPLPQGPGPNPGLAVEGSGGGYLSNEIFYRNSLLRTQLGASVPVIHLHTPSLAPNAADTVRNNLIATIRQLLLAALPSL